MKIGVNARFLGSPYTGIGQYTLNLFETLARQNPKDEFFLLVPYAPQEALRLPKNIHVVVVPEKPLFLAGLKKTWWEQVQVPLWCVTQQITTVFFTYPGHPWRRVWHRRFTTLVAVHDCIPWMDRRYRRGMLSRWYHFFSRRTVRLCAGVVTVSEHSKQDIMRLCRVPEERICVTHNDASPLYRKKVSTAVMRASLGVHELTPKRYFLYCGGYDVRKNVPLLIEAYSEYAREAGKDAPPLVLAGGQVLRRALYSSFEEARAVHGRIVKTGFLEPSSLAALYAGCTAFIHLSANEGFNIPLLEAACQRAPLILSDTEVHREIAREQAYFVDLSSFSSIVSAMRAMSDPVVQHKYMQKSSVLAKAYSWEKSAQIIGNMLHSKR